MKKLEDLLKSLDKISLEISWDAKENHFFASFVLPNEDRGTAISNTLSGLLIEISISIEETIFSRET